jgi:putative FmdB family regulatory protein
MIYEYVCESCGHEWEVEQKVSDVKIKECPSCNKDTAKRVISKSSFQLKGSGWFKDGY